MLSWFFLISPQRALRSNHVNEAVIVAVHLLSLHSGTVLQLHVSKLLWQSIKVKDRQSWGEKKKKKKKKVEASCSLIRDKVTAKREMEQTEVVKPETLDELIKILHKIFESDHINVEEVQNIMESYESKPHEWRKYAKFDQYR